MENSIRQRIKDVLMLKNTSINKFADGNPSLQTRLSRQINQGASISCDTIVRILSTYPDISAEWLIRGEGVPNLEDSLSLYNGEEDDDILDLKVKHDKLKIEHEEELIEHQKLLSQLEYMEEYNQRLVLEVHNLKKRLSAYEKEKKDII